MAGANSSRQIWRGIFFWFFTFLRTPCCEEFISTTKKDVSYAPGFMVDKNAFNLCHYFLLQRVALHSLKPAELSLQPPKNMAMIFDVMAIYLLQYLLVLQSHIDRFVFCRHSPNHLTMISPQGCTIPTFKLRRLSNISLIRHHTLVWIQKVF